MAKAPRSTRIFIYGFFILLVIGSVFIMIPRESKPKQGQAILPPNQYSLAIGEAKTVRGIQFGFLNVESDDRCVGQGCASPGNATLIFKAHGINDENVRVDTDNPGVYLNYTLRVVKLDPTPIIDFNKARVIIEIKQTETQ